MFFLSFFRWFLVIVCCPLWNIFDGIIIIKFLFTYISKYTGNKHICNREVTCTITMKPRIYLCDIATSLLDIQQSVVYNIHNETINLILSEYVLFAFVKFSSNIHFYVNEKVVFQRRQKLICHQKSRDYHTHHYS